MSNSSTTTGAKTKTTEQTQSRQLSATSATGRRFTNDWKLARGKLVREAMEEESREVGALDPAAGWTNAKVHAKNTGLSQGTQTSATACGSGLACGSGAEGEAAKKNGLTSTAAEASAPDPCAKREETWLDRLRTNVEQFEAARVILRRGKLAKGLGGPGGVVQAFEVAVWLECDVGFVARVEKLAAWVAGMTGAKGEWNGAGALPGLVRAEMLAGVRDGHGTIKAEYVGRAPVAVADAA